MKTRSFASGAYKYGFNGMEKDDEINGDGNSYTTEFRQLDTRLGRWLSIDPKATSFAMHSPYVSINNNPILMTDILGDSSVVDNKGNMIHYDVEDQDLRVFIKDNDKLEHIGEIGGNINTYSFIIKFIEVGS